MSFVCVQKRRRAEEQRDLSLILHMVYTLTDISGKVSLGLTDISGKVASAAAHRSRVFSVASQ
jgi:hypothetical protein